MEFRYHNFIQRTLLKILDFFKEAIFSQEYAQRNGFLQRLSPRLKVSLTVLAILIALMSRNIKLLALMYLFCLLFASRSKIDLRYFLKRTWLFIPLFSIFIALPAFFSDTSFALLFVARVLVAVSYIMLLNLSMEHTRLLKVLRSFKAPQLFVMILGMCYRYIFLFAEIIENTYFAVKSRVGGAIHYKHGQHIAIWNIASLWQRSLELNKEIYNAMLSRGYTGEPKVLDE